MDALELTKELVRKDSSGDCKKIGAYLETLLTREGFQVERQPVDATGFNIIARKGRPEIIFLCHMDSVKAAGWTRDPFKASVERGRLYGLGAVDMKAGLAAAIVAARSVPDTMLVITIGEESTFNGILTFIKNTKALTARLLVCPEPTDLCIADSHRGCIVVEVVAKGIPAHAARPELGRNALLLCDALKAVERQLAELDSTMNIGYLEAGDRQSINQVAARAQALLDIRPSKALFTKGTDYLRTIIEKAVTDAGLTLESLDIPVAVPPMEGDKAVRERTLKVLEAAGIPTVERPFFGFTEAATVQTCYGIPCVILGAGPMKMMHCADEYVDTASIEILVRMFEVIVTS